MSRKARFPSSGLVSGAWPPSGTILFRVCPLERTGACSDAILGSLAPYLKLVSSCAPSVANFRSLPPPHPGKFLCELAHCQVRQGAPSEANFREFGPPSGIFPPPPGKIVSTCGPLRKPAHFRVRSGRPLPFSGVLAPPSWNKFASSCGPLCRLDLVHLCLAGSSPFLGRAPPIFGSFAPPPVREQIRLLRDPVHLCPAG